MNESIIPQSAREEPGFRPGLLDGVARSAILKRLAALRHGELIVRDGLDEYRFGGRTAECGLSATITVESPRFYSLSAFEGSVGAGDAYVRGDWSCDDLTSLVRIFVLNRDVLEGMESGFARLGVPVLKFLHGLRRNSRDGSRRNIAAHYDLGNDFYSLFLDDTMTYSSGIFACESSTLKDASLAKIRRLCDRLQLKEGDELLEIGTGWGGLAVVAAKEYGARVTTTTISREQYEYAVKRVRNEDLEDRVTLLFEDYRDLKGEYDKIVSVEMIEAVGWQYYDTFMETCSRLLKPGGSMAMQAITIRDHLYEDARRNVDFIKHFIFPGSCIPSVTALLSSATRSSDMTLASLEDITPHYARTLREWRERFFANIHAVRRLGYSDAFVRMWEYYLCYCEGGFLERNIGTVQMLFTRPANRMRHPLPELCA